MRDYFHVFRDNARHYGMTRIEDDLIRMCAAFRRQHPESKLTDADLWDVMKVAREVLEEATTLCLQ